MPGSPSSGSRSLVVAAVYSAALISGLTVVSFAASATALKAALALSDAQYGAIFLPQVVMTIIGSLAGGALSARRSLGSILGAALLVFVGAEAALWGTSRLSPAVAYPVLLAGTASRGFRLR